MTPAGVYLLIGREDFLKREFLQDLRRRLFQNESSAGLNSKVFHSKTDSLNDLFDFLRTAPFLSEARMAVLRGAEDLSGQEKERLLSWLSSPPASGVLAIVSEEGSVKKDPFLKALSQKARLVACHPPFERDLQAWIDGRVKKSGLTIERGAIFLLIERAGRGLGHLNSALEQLAVYVHPRRSVTLKDVESLLGKSVQADTFELADTLLEKDAKAALGMIGSLLKEGTRAYEILAVLAGQLERLGRAAALSERGTPMADITGELKVHPFFAEKFARQVRRSSAAELRRLLQKLLACDEAVKTGQVSDRLALERFVLELCLEEEKATASAN